MYSETKINNNQFQNLIISVLLFLAENLKFEFNFKPALNMVVLRASKLIILQANNRMKFHARKLAQIKSCAH